MLWNRQRRSKHPAGEMLIRWGKNGERSRENVALVDSYLLEYSHKDAKRDAAGCFDVC